MDAPKAETNGVAYAAHQSEPNQQDAKTSDKVGAKGLAVVAQVAANSSSNNVVVQQTPANTSQQVVPPLVLATKASKNEKKAQNSFAIVNKNQKKSQNKDEGRRVTRHSPQNSETNSTVSTTKSSTSKTNGQTDGSATSAATLSPSKANSKQLPTKQVFAHKRSPSSPLPPNPFVNSAQVKATKSKPIPPPTPPKDPTPTLKANFLAAQKSRAEANSVPKAEVKRSKRKAETKKSSVKADTEENSETRASKRVRLQYQPFQSPEPIPPVPFIYRASTLAAPKKEEDEKLIIYNNNEFLAVRNETNGFYICRAKQNVFKNSRKFKIQWFNNDKNPAVYSADFYDVTDFECILTNLSLIRLDNGRFQLPDDEKQRINNILQRAINVEKGTEKPDPIKVIADGVDISVVGKVDEKELLKKISPKRSKKEPVKAKKAATSSPAAIASTSSTPKASLRSKRQMKAPLTPSPSTPSKTIATRQSRTDKVQRRSGRSTSSTGKAPVSPKLSPSAKTSPKDKKPGIAEVVKKLKTKARSAKLDSKKKSITPVKKTKKLTITPKKKSPRVAAAALSDKKSKTAATKPTTPSPKPKKRFVLISNLNVSSVEKEQFFETSQAVPHISTLVDSKLLIRAVILKDHKLLEKLISDKKKICSLCMPRCLAIKRDALSYAIEAEDLRAVKLLTDGEHAKNLAPYPDLMISSESTGYGSKYMFGHALRAVNVGRGGKEGNNALIKDSDLYGHRTARYVEYLDESVIKDGLKFGIKFFSIEKLCAQSKAHSDQTMNEFLGDIVTAVRYGHCRLAYDLVEHAIKKGGFGFNELHKESLSSGKQFSPFRAVSIVKKAIGNSRITPIHCAAINPDPYFMTTLLTQRPDYTILDLDHWTPVHYAAVSQGSANLEYLLNHGVSTLLIEKEGNTPLHLACLRNRVQNVEVIIRHESSTDSGATALSLEKANRIGLAPIHIAAQEGYVDVIKALVKAGADVEKPTAATLDKLTPMMMAAQLGHLSALKFLVECGANPESVDKKHRTALTHAVMNGQSHIVSYLLRLGANPNTRDSSGNTLVHYACAYGWYFCYKLLLEAKARLNETNDWKMTPMCIAFMKGHTGLAEAVMKESGVDIDIPINDSNGMNLLMQTCQSKPNDVMIDRLKFLIERGADCSKTDYDNNNALHYLVRNESKIISEHRYLEEESRQKSGQFVEKFYDPIQDREVMANIQELQYLTAHHKEIIESERQKILEAAQLLIDNKCDPQAINKKKMSPFMLAAQLGSFVLLHKLLDLNRKQLNAETNSDGDTLLHLFVNHAITEISAHGRKSSVAKFVREIYESDETLKSIFRQMCGIENKAGLKPIHQFLKIYSGQYAVETEEILLDFLRFLVETLESDINSAIVCHKPEDIEYVIHLTAKCKTKSFVNLILSKKPLLEQLNGKKRTALAIAIIDKNIDISKLLIEAGADVKFVSENDNNLSLLLLEAVNNTKTFELIPLLVSKGAAVNDFESKGRNTALHYIASRAVQRACPDAIEALVRAGANINAHNKNGRTPLHLAVNSRRGGTDVSFDVEECLLKSGAKTDIRDNRGRIALHYAFVKIGAHRDHSFLDPIELVALLDSSELSTTGQRPVTDVADTFGSTPLHYAAQRGATISCMHLLRQANINSIDNNDNTPLGLAVLHGHEGCALMLQQKGAAFIQPIGFLNRKPELRQSVDDNSLWKWNRIKDEDKLKREIEAKKSKCSIIEEVVRNDWQGILYLMINELTTLGRGVSVAIESALKTNRLNLGVKLLKRLKSNKNLNLSDQTLLHVLAKESFDFERQSELQQLIVKLLISHEVQLSAVDTQFKSNAIIYSAINWNHILCNEMTQLMGTDTVLSLEYDALSRTPVTAAFWELHNKSNSDLSEQMKVWINKLLEKSPQLLNTLSYYPVLESHYAGVRYQATNVNLTSITNSPKYSPLIFAILCGNYSVVKYLLNLKINGSHVVDINLADSLGRTPLMHSVRLNDLKMVKLLLNRTYSPEDDEKAWDSRNLTFENKNSIDLTAKDANGWTVLHHLVSPLENFTYLNSDVILRLLWHVTNNSKPEVQLFDVPNSKNETPLQIAVSRNSKNLVKTLNDMLDKRNDDLNIDLSSVLPHFPKIQTNFISEEFDFKSDSIKMIEQIDAKLMDIEEEKIFKPDGLIAIDNADVVIDTTLDLAFDALLTKVDLEYGVYGLYNFYKMQIIEQKSKDLVLLFTRWGRIGDIGQYQKTPFTTLDESIKEFKKIFKAKTGNNWESVKQFSAVPKKYRLVNVERRVKQKQRQYKLDIDSAIKAVETKLPNPLFDLMKNLISVHSTADALRSYGNGESFTPFGLLKTETLQKAENILTQIEKLIEEKESIKQKDSNDYSKVTHEMIDLSEEFYHLIPLFGYQYERLNPLFTREELRDKMELIFNLVHFEFAFELLLAAQLKAQEVNPADYVYKCLGTHLELLSQNEEESQLILQYIHNTGHNPRIKAIYRINRSGEEDRFNANNVGNNWMLWHGTKVTNVISILANGLQKAPLSAQISGHTFGKGIYFADMFTKSQNYCSGFGSEFNGQKYMFLCEVSLGNIEDVRINSRSDKLKPQVNSDKHSLKTSHSQYRPDPQTSVYWKGRSVPLGPSVKNQMPENDFYELNYNEYIVFRSEQICLRYLIQFSD